MHTSELHLIPLSSEADGARARALPRKQDKCILYCIVFQSSGDVVGFLSVVCRGQVTSYGTWNMEPTGTNIEPMFVLA